MPSKPLRSDKLPSKKQAQCYEKLTKLITKVKNDVSQQSIILNQSRPWAPAANTSRLYKATDMTNESAFPNMTHEELHFSLNKYGGGIDEPCVINNIQPE